MLATVFAVLIIIIIASYCVIYYVQIHLIKFSYKIVCQHHLPAILKIKRQTQVSIMLS